jgi:hypothetical protein
MPTPTPIKVAYLFGAGATHAELVNGHPKANDATFLAENGLLMHQVSKRVCEKAKALGKFPKSIEALLSPAGLSNVELFSQFPKVQLQWRQRPGSRTVSDAVDSTPTKPQQRTNFRHGTFPAGRSYGAWKI